MTERRVRHGPGLLKARTAPVSRARGLPSLTREAEELLFAHAELLTEARIDAEGYQGCTMFSVSLAELAPHLRVRSTDALGEELLALSSGSVRVRVRAMRFACAEATRRVPERTFSTFSTETRMRIDRDHLLIDVDVHATFVTVGSEVGT